MHTPIRIPGLRAAVLPALAAAALAGGSLAAHAAPPESGKYPELNAAAMSGQGVPSGVQWFTRLKDGLAEAKRTGRPILYLSAAPSCGGIPGVW